jgi:uncharacterized protein YggE
MKRMTLYAMATLSLAGAAMAQERTAGSSAGTPQDRDVSASTYGSGTSTPDSVEVSGGGTATAADGGTATTNSTAKFNQNMARQRSTAKARGDDERARSTSTTRVHRDGEVRSRSMSIYKQRGEKPVIEREVSTSGK